MNLVAILRIAVFDYLSVWECVSRKCGAVWLLMRCFSLDVVNALCQLSRFGVLLFLQCKAWRFARILRSSMTILPNFRIVVILFYEMASILYECTSYVLRALSCIRTPDNMLLTNLQRDICFYLYDSVTFSSACAFDIRLRSDCLNIELSTCSGVLGVNNRHSNPACPT